jgi:hypothetical protein
LENKDTQILDLSKLTTSIKGNYSIKASLDMIKFLVILDIVFNIIIFIAIVIILSIYKF